MTETLCKCSLFVLMAYTAGLHGQSVPIPIQSGLWQTTITGTNTVALPPEQEAKIAALPAAQQAMIRNMSGGGKPTTITTKSCAAQATSVDALISQAQQKNTKCTLTNQTQTAGGASFDVSCVTQQGTASGHAAFQMADSEHISGTMHMTVDATGNGGAMHMTIDNTITSKYLGADCGTVKPGAAVVVQ